MHFFWINTKECLHRAVDVFMERRSNNETKRHKRECDHSEFLVTKEKQNAVNNRENVSTFMFWRNNALNDEVVCNNNVKKTWKKIYESESEKKGWSQIF